MKTWLPYFGAVVVGLTLATALSPAQTSAPPQTPPVVATVTALAAAIQAQQAQIAANQALMSTKMTELAENVRQARIFARRGGGGGATQ